ncbi:MAG: cbb3-type cytochrome c oxidase subunit I [Solirubrobacterales bacterium]
MSATAASEPALRTTGIAHPDGVDLDPEPDRNQRLVGWLFGGAGLTLFAVMGLLGLTMRLTQADVLDISPAWFYRLMTLHGAGMLAGAMLAMMGGLWYVIRASVPLSLGRMLASLGAILLGAVAIVVAVIIGGFAAGWTFLDPLPFDSAGQWGTWATATFFSGMVLVGVGFFIYCIDVLTGTTAAYGGLSRALGIPFLRGRDPDPPPPQVIAATVVSAQGLLASTVGTTILIALLGRTIDSGVALDALWAKNLTYFFGHSFANLIIYIGAGLVYVLLPRYAGRPWKTTKPLALGWLATLLLVTIAYSHHLYMDFAQPETAQVISTAASSAAALPVAVVTIYTGMMLVWGSRYRWTLASILIYLGFAGWAIGGSGAVIDSLIPVNLRFHNTLWVPAHFHTYLMLGVILWAMAFITHLLERAAARPASRAATLLAPSAMALGGYGLVGVWYVSGALGIPRRMAVHPPGTDGYSLVASFFVIVFALGFLVLLAEFTALGRDALRRRRASSLPPMPRIAGAAPSADPAPSFPLRTPAQIGVAVGAAVACVFVFLPDIGDAAEATAQLHHLQHAVQFLMGLALGAAVICSIPRRASLGAGWRDAGLVALILAPVIMLLLMIPGIYGGLEGNPLWHATYHGLIVLLGLITGAGASLQGRVVGRLLLVLSLGMALLYAAGVTGG